MRQFTYSDVTIVDKCYILAFTHYYIYFMHEYLCNPIFYAINNSPLPVIARRALRDVAIQKTGCS